MERGICTPPKHNWCSNPRHLGGALQDLHQYISVCLVLGSLKSHTVLHVKFCSRGTGFGAYVCKRKKTTLKVTKTVQMFKILCIYSVIKLSKPRHFHFSIAVFSIVTLIQEKHSSSSLKACSLKMMPT